MDTFRKKTKNGPDIDNNSEFEQNWGSTLIVEFGNHIYMGNPY